MTLFERRAVFGMLFLIVGQTAANPITGAVLGVISMCYLVGAIFTKDGAGHG